MASISNGQNGAPACLPANALGQSALLRRAESVVSDDLRRLP
jgi:hypothetical protein